MESQSMRSLLLAALLTIALAGLCEGEAAAGYREEAESLVTNPPNGIVIRADLEKTIDGLANDARASRGRKRLVASPAFKAAARAQAIDMALGDFVGHRSRKGQSFSVRFAAFAGDADRFPARGENAARDRGDGPPDGAKARRLFQQWLDSGGHRRNLLGTAYDLMSSGVIQKGDHVYAVQIFWAEPQPAATLATGTKTSGDGRQMSGEASPKPKPKRSILTVLKNLWPG
jgi:uncharacterized protein YkwD